MTATLTSLHEEHVRLLAGIEAIKETADLIDLEPSGALEGALEDSHMFLARHLIPHAKAEERVLYRAYDQVADSPWATDTMKRDHVAIEELTRELSGLQIDLSMDEPLPEQKQALRRVLYGLYALLKVHFSTEEELLLPRLEAGLTQEAADHLVASLEAATRENEATAGW